MTAKIAGMVSEEFFHLIARDPDLMKIMRIVADSDLIVVVVTVVMVVVMIPFMVVVVMIAFMMVVVMS
jgi:hypothetical protein